MKDFIKETKTTRLSLDLLIFRAKQNVYFGMDYKHNNCGHSSECIKGLESLMLAKGWLGKLLKTLGDETPYTPANKVEDIPPTAEQFKEEEPKEVEPQERPTKLEFCNWIRKEIETNIIDCWGHLPLLKEVEYAIKSLEEASMWYGFEIGALKEANESYK